MDTLVKTSPLSQRINLVFIPDGYLAAEMPLFLARVNRTLTSLFAESPFREYRAYFNAFAIKVPSAQSGSTHPRTAADCGAVTAFSADTYFGSSFDYAGLHRFLYPPRLAGRMLPQQLLANVHAGESSSSARVRDG